MDPGTALGVASLAYDITKDLYDYYRAWKHCEQDVKELRCQLLWLSEALDLCRSVFGKAGVSADGTLLVCKALANCKDATTELQEILKKVKKEGDPKSVVEKLKASTRRACYPFRRATVGEIVDNVEACKDAVHLAVDLLHLDSSTEHYLKLQDLDNKLVAIDAALEPLPTVHSNVIATKDQTDTIRADTGAIRNKQQSAEVEKTLKETMDWLCPADYGQQQNDIYARRTRDTCKWFLESSEYLALRKGELRTLVCTGQPGAGKTYLASTAINELLQSEEIPTVGIAYIFCNYKRQVEQTLDHCLAALVRQLLYRKGSVPSSLADTYHQHKSRNSRPSPDELTEALASLAQALAATYIVIDALDEGDNNVCADLFSILQRIQVGSNLRLMLTTRPLREILGLIENYQTLEVRASDADVRLFLETQMKALIVRIDTELQERIVRAIVSAVGGMFLLAKFHMDSLKKCPSKSTLLKALAKLPEGSDTAVYAKVYSDAMDRICGQSPPLAGIAKDALSWITFAKRPLKAQELRHALAIDRNAEMDDIHEEDLYDLDLVLSLCAGLIVEDEQSNAVRLVHHTAQKFFEDNCKTWLPNAESTLALTCLRCLSFQSLSTGACKTRKTYAYRYTRYALLDYSASNWSTHVNASAGADGLCAYELVQKAALYFLQDVSLIRCARQVMMNGVPGDFPPDQPPGGFRGWHLVGLCGAGSLVAALLNADSGCDCRDDWGMTPLSYAAKCGHSTVLKLLLGTGKVQADSRNVFGESPLIHGAIGGHEEVVELLVGSAQVDVNMKDKIGQTPLSWSAKRGFRGVAQLLLGTGKVDIDSRNYCDVTPLMVAVSHGSESIVKLLLDTGQVDANSTLEGGQTALMVAARRGDVGIMQHLIGTGHTDVDATDRDGATALMFAVGYGQDIAVQCLLDTHRADVNAVGPRGWTPLTQAAALGCASTVQLLLNTGLADVDSKDHGGRTPLSHAVSNVWGCPIVKLLLDTGQVDVNATDSEGKTPLIYAAFEGNSDVIQLLLETGQVDINAANKQRRTSLMLAAKEGHNSAVQCLLDAGHVHVDAPSQDGQTALMFAAKRGYNATVQSLLDTYMADVNATDSAGRTALSEAVAGGRARIVKLLLESGQIKAMPRMLPKKAAQVSKGDYGSAIEVVEAWREQPEDIEAALQWREAVREDQTLAFEGLKGLFGE